MSNNSPGLVYDQVPTAAQWNAFFSAKQDWNAILDTIIAAGGAPLPGDVVAETARAEAAEATITASVTTERNRALAAEGVNATAISTETSRATTAEGVNATAAAAAQTTANNALPKAGGTMTGAITLQADPAAALQPATKQYVDAATGTSTANIGRNLIHNGEFLIQQRALPVTANNAYSADRWMQEIGGNTTISTSVAALADADRTAIGDEAALWRLTPSWTTGTINAADLALVEQRMEGTQRYGGKSITVSFWARSAVGTPSVGVGLRQNFGTGGSPSAAVDVNATAVALSTTWARKTVTIAVPTTIGKTIGTTAGTDYTAIRLFLASGTTNNTIAGGIGDQASNIVHFWGVQVEVGTSATALEKKSVGQYMGDCQRYYQVHNVLYYVNGLGAGAQNPRSESLQPPMRATPTAAILANGNLNTTGFAITPGGPGYVTMNFTATATGDTEVSVQFSASADL